MPAHEHHGHDHDHHGHGHGHGHDHGHDHHGHAPENFDRAFAIGIALNLGFVAVEAFWGWRADSLALLADAGHNLSDVAGLVLAWAGAVAGRLRPGPRHTYGFKRASILAALGNALLLLVALGMLGWEALQRLQSPRPSEGVTVMVVAAVGIAVNGFTAWLFMRGADDLNLRGAFLHMLADALVSAGVVLAGALTLWFGWLWLDPLASIVIVLVILVGTWNLLAGSVHLLFDGVPRHIDITEVQRYLAGRPGVARVHDLHVWAMGTSDVALTAHLVMPDGAADEAFLREATQDLKQRFRIGHVTLQTAREAVGPRCGEA